MRICILFSFLVIVLMVGANGRADIVTLHFSGTIDSVTDASLPTQPPIDFAPIPVGSSFGGTISFNASASPTDGGVGYARYLDLTPSSGSLTANGYQFVASPPGFSNPAMVVVSQEAGFGYSGYNVDTQPISLPAGWSVPDLTFPYFTLQFWNIPGQTQSLALPTKTSDFPLGYDHLILDFDDPLTVDGHTYGGRVYIDGTITSFMVGVPEPSALAIATLGGICLVAYDSRRRRTC
jgi:hypothetical protein